MADIDRAVLANFLQRWNTHVLRAGSIDETDFCNTQGKHGCSDTRPLSDADASADGFTGDTIAIVATLTGVADSATLTAVNFADFA